MGEELSVGPVVGMVAQWAKGDAAPEGDAGPEMDLDGNKHHKLDVAPLSDPERLSHGLEHDPFFTAAEAGFAMHPFTGAFADPSHQSSFAGQLFRGALPFHVLLMIMVNAVVLFMELNVVPALQPLWAIVGLTTTVFLVCRIPLHCMQDAARAQRIGSCLWTALYLPCVITDISMAVMEPVATCVPTQEKFLVRQLIPVPSPNLNLNPNLP